MKNETLKQQAYNIIKEKIINCDYPPNMVLSEEKLREEIAASRTPIRDALSRLESENLVKILPKKGIIVSPLSIRDINMIHEARILIEPFAINKYGYKIPIEKFQEYLKFFRKESLDIKDYNLMYEYDNRLHQDFIDATDNDYIISTYERIFSQIRRLRIFSGVKEKNRLHETQQEHCRIIMFCLSEDWEKAAEVMKEHLNYSKKASLEAALKDEGLEI